MLDRSGQQNELEHYLLRVNLLRSQSRRPSLTSVWTSENLALCSIPIHIFTPDETPQPLMNEYQTIFAVFEGEIYNIAEIKRLLGSDHKFRTNCSGEALIHLYEKYGDNFLNRLNGKFVFALWDATNRKLLLGRDHLGIEPLFYSDNGKRFVFGSSLKSLLVTELVSKQLNYEAVLQYLLYCYNLGDETFIRNIYKLPAGCILSLDSSGVSIKKYWYLSFADTQEKTEDQYCEELLNLIKSAIKIRLESNHSPGVFLSGGIDSSAIVALTSMMLGEPFPTFSFRCQGKSYDESHYARFVAQHYGTQHTEISYDPNHLLLISKAVKLMEEPFCDNGIEVGTYLLGMAAQNKVTYVFSGEGSDELFGGHPVYVADKLAALVNLFPRLFLKPLTQVLQKIPDSDQKKNLQVQLKRFAYGISFPSELLSHRWRIYYTTQELRELCTNDFLEQCDIHKMFDCVFKYNQEANGSDKLSHSLYCDFYTLVGFYLRRLGLLRAFSLESWLPFLDYRLVDYAAKIPSRLKVKGLSDTKYIYKKALKEILPGEILYNRPKLGHSVPMKNWLRDNVLIRNWVESILFDKSFKDRGLFRMEFVKRMLEEHMRKTHNYSHRLWGLTVLELWFRSRLDS